MCLTRRACWTWAHGAAPLDRGRLPLVGRAAAVGTTAFTCFNAAWGGGAFTSCLPLHSASWGPGCLGLLSSSHYLGPCVQSSSITPETAPPLLGTIQMAFIKLPRFQNCPGPVFKTVFIVVVLWWFIKKDSF